MLDKKSLLQATQLLNSFRFNPAIKQIRTFSTHRFAKVQRRGGKRKRFFTKHYPDPSWAYYQHLMSFPRTLSYETVENMKKSFLAPIKIPGQCST